MGRSRYHAEYDATVLTADGTAGTNCAIETFGTKHNRTVKITASAVAVPAIAGGADLAVGMLVWTAPAGVIDIRSAYMSMAIQQVDGNINADTPDGGLGTVIGSGAVATLDGTATFEDILTGQTFNNCTGTAEVASVATAMQMLAAGAHTVYFNIADGWAASGDANATASGVIIINYDWFAAT